MSNTLQFKSVRVHLKTNPDLKWDTYFESLGPDFVQKGDEYTYQGSETLKVLEFPPGGSIKLKLDGGSLSFSEIAMNLDLIIEKGSVNGLNFSGTLFLEGSDLKLDFTDFKGIVRTHLKNCQFNLDGEMIGSDLSLENCKSILELPEEFEGRLEFNLVGGDLRFHCKDRDSVMIHANDNEFHHFGSKARFFVNIAGKADFLGWLDSVEKQQKKETEAQARVQRFKVETEELDEKSEELISLFEKFEDRVESEYELQEELSDSLECQKNQGPQVNSSSKPGPTQEESESDRHYYELYKKNAITLEELEKFLNQG